MDNPNDKSALIHDETTSSSSDNDGEGSCRDSITSEVYVRRPGMKSMFRRFRVSLQDISILFTPSNRPLTK
jgi:hypothetical protein